MAVLNEAEAHVHDLEHHTGGIARLQPLDGGHVTGSFFREEQVWTGNVTGAVEPETKRGSRRELANQEKDEAYTSLVGGDREREILTGSMRQ